MRARGEGDQVDRGLALGGNQAVQVGDQPAFRGSVGHISQRHDPALQNGASDRLCNGLGRLQEAGRHEAQAGDFLAAVT